MNLLNNSLKIKKGQTISFYYNGNTYKRKVQSVFIQSFNGLTNYNVNKIGCGTGFTSIDAEDVII
jgi:hypothetical protein